MNTSALSDANLQDALGLQQFFDLNAIDHEVIFAAIMEQQSFAIEHRVMWKEGEIDADWLFSHDAEHRAISQALSLGVPPDLAFLDPKDVAQSSDWLNNHVNAHQLIIAALGL